MRSVILIALVALTACNGSGTASKKSVENLAMIDVGEAPPPSQAGVVAPVALAQIAYSYSFTYQLAQSAIAPLQAAHIALCDQLGPARCRVERSITSGGEDNASASELVLHVDSRVARAFGTRLDAAATGAGGEATRHEVSGEDLSKAMIDTGARIRAKQALADRLLALLRTRTGGVADLVAAERAYADVQGELDAARGQMADMQGRVAQSKIEITYLSRESGNRGFLRPVGDAAREGGETLGVSLAALLTFVIAALPWLLLLAALVATSRKLGWRVRRPWRRKQRDEV